MKTKVNFQQAIVAGLLAGVVAAVINVILFFVFHSTGIITDTIFIQPNQPMSAIPIVISSIVPLLIGSVVFFAIEKFTNKGFLIFSIVAIVLGLASFANPFMGIPNVTLGYAMALNLMHVVVVASLLFFLKRAVKSADKK